MMSLRTEYRRENDSVAVGIGATASIWSFVVPQKARFRFKSFGNYLGTVAAWGTAFWFLNVNSVVWPFVGGNPNVMDQVGYAAQRQVITEDEFGGGTRLEIFGVNPTAAILSMGVSVEYELIYSD